MGLKALVIEDSLVFQKIMSSVLEDLGGVDEICVAGFGKEGLAKIESFGPDVIFLDLHLPDMDGMDILEELKKTGKKHRVVVVSGMSHEGADLTIQALSKGAQQFIRKPSSGGFQASVQQLRAELKPVLATVDMQTSGALRTPSRPVGPAPVPVSTKPPKQTAAEEVMARRQAPGLAPPVMNSRPPAEGMWITAIAVSTGGPQALQKVIPLLPANYPTPVVMVQHMPPLFTDSLAKSLDKKSQLTVVEAKEGMVLERGTVYIAPGGRHLVVKKIDGKPVACLNDDPQEQSVRPAADVLFRSLSHYPNTQGVLAVVMTGMGEDGLAGVRALKQKTCFCLTQSEDSCVVYGMPRSVDEAGLSDGSVELEALAEHMVNLATGSRFGVGV